MGCARDGIRTCKSYTRYGTRYESRHTLSFSSSTVNMYQVPCSGEWNTFYSSICAPRTERLIVYASISIMPLSRSQAWYSEYKYSTGTFYHTYRYKVRTRYISYIVRVPVASTWYETCEYDICQENRQDYRVPPHVVSISRYILYTSIYRCHRLQDRHLLRNYFEVFPFRVQLL